MTKQDALAEASRLARHDTPYWVIQLGDEYWPITPIEHEQFYPDAPILFSTEDDEPLAP